MISKIRNTLVMATLLFSGYASANSIINLNSTVYGAFNNSIDESLASTSAVFLGRGSDYFITGNIVFTDTSGIIRNVLATNNDNFYWSWNNQQNSLIGTMANASFMNRVELLNNGVLTSYMGDINAMNGNRGFCCSAGVQKLEIATGSGNNVPEPATVLLTGLGLLAIAARRRNQA